MSSLSSLQPHRTEFRAVLFDLFGTLVPCYPLVRIQEIIELMAWDLGVDAEDFSEYWNETFTFRRQGKYSSLLENIQQVVHKLGQDPEPAKVEASARRRLSFERQALRPRPSALPTLAALQKLGLHTAIISNCSQETTEVWGLVELGAAADHCMFSCSHGCEKPAPEAYLHSCTALGVEPHDCLFVGDGSSDELRGATDLGMEAVLIRADDDDCSYPDRISLESWTGARISDVCEVLDLICHDSTTG